MAQLAAPAFTLGSATSGSVTLTKSIPPISFRVGDSCDASQDLVYQCSFSAATNTEQIVQCANRQIVFVNTCTAVAGMQQSGGACVWYDYGSQGNNAKLGYYLPYCVNLVAAHTSIPTTASVYVNGQIVQAQIPASVNVPGSQGQGVPAGPAAAATTTKSSADIANVGVVAAAAAVLALF
ncbi:hypothetical protein HDU79_006679 [Rhizoclosmatium sp. JEL0117]|nr:hypothetical protein HDU79_006679 [Rhizoclosmatium sp. JEL0117]